MVLCSGHQQGQSSPAGTEDKKMSNTFIAFSTITGSALASAGSAEKARLDAVKEHELQNDDFIEVIDASLSKIPAGVLTSRFLY